MMRKPSLNDRIQSLGSLEEIDGYLQGIAQTGREMFPLEEQLLERRIEALEARKLAVSGRRGPSWHAAGGNSLRVVLRALSGRVRGSGDV